MSSLWCIGKNEYNECGLDTKNFPKPTKSNTDDSELDCSDDDNEQYKVERLTLCEWSKTKNITAINHGCEFNIYSTTSNRDELLSYGYIRDIQETLPYKKYAFYIIPNGIALLCLTYFGNNFNQYWSCGTNDDGQCAVGHQNDILSITQIHGMKNIAKIVTNYGAFSVLWMTNDGKLYVNGDNYEQQLGGNFDGKMSVSTPKLCPFSEISAAKVVDAAMTEECCIIACNDGSVWSSGTGEFGENGHGRNPESTNEFTQITSLSRYKIISVKTGAWFVVFLSDTGNIFTCGSNGTAQLGLGDSHDNYDRLPTKIPYFEKNKIKIKQIVCGSNHSIALDENDGVWGWGSNYSGQCGVGKNLERDTIPTPTLIETLSNKKVLTIKSGVYHSGCVCRDNMVYLWGTNFFNECCYITDVKSENSRKLYLPYCINQYVYKTTNAKKIIDVTLGCNTTMILVEEDVSN